MDLSLLPLVFSLILSVASRLLLLYCTNDKTSRLMVKRFPTVRDTQRGLRSYMERRRGRREIEVTRRRIGGIKREESNPASNQIPMCSLLSAWNTQRGSQSYIEKRRGRKEIEVTRRRRGGVRRRETDLASNQFSKYSPQPGIPKESHRVGLEKRRRREEIEVTWGRKRTVKRGRGQSSQ